MTNVAQTLRENFGRWFPTGDENVSIIARRTLSGVRRAGAVVSAIRRMPSKTVERHPEPNWQRWGWQKNGNVYCGLFRCLEQEWRGEIRERPGGGYDTYIWNPPDWVLTGAHGRCFQPRGEGMFLVHQQQPDTVDHAIRSVELAILGRM